jgi:hypothetical protein
MVPEIYGAMKSEKRGRPATGVNPSIHLRVPEGLLEAIDDFRRRQPDQPSRPEAVRRVLERALIEPQD